MGEKPIAFSGEMVRAILEGRKSQTRRVCRAQQMAGFEPWGSCADGWQFWIAKTAPLELKLKSPDRADHHGNLVTRCPYGRSGDRLWVRETWALVPRTAYAQSEGVEQALRPGDDHDAAVYRAGWTRSEPGPWRSSRFMPRWASRITLQLLDVRVQRVQEITPEDVEAEGASHNPMQQMSYRDDNYQRIKDFAWLWDSINAKRGYTWDSNPWVWCISFKRVEA